MAKNKNKNPNSHFTINDVLSSLNENDPKVELLDIEKEIKEDYEKQKEKYEKNSKPLKELLVYEKFYVAKYPVQEAFQTNFTPYSELIFGGKSMNYEGGLNYLTKIKVKPLNKKTKIGKIYFNSSTSLKLGDYFSALIPKFTKKELNSYLSHVNPKKKRIFYFDRPFYLDEVVFEINILSKNNSEILKNEKSPEYFNFLKDKNFKY
ncbi:MAG: hypothetical protein ACLFPJ_03025 [Candidatus Woesearchaeota archaeon]